MAFNINDFRGQLTQGGARPALFEVQLSGPSGGLGGGADVDLIFKSPFMVRTAQLPAQNIGQIVVPYFGRQIKLAGNRTFEDWTTTVINDEDFKIRNAVEIWQERINSHEANLREFGTNNPADYRGQATVTQFSKNGQRLRTYKFVGFYPQNISAIELSWDADSVEEFSITWAYDYWTVSGATAIGEVPGTNT